MEYVHLGGEDRPIAFGFRMQYIHEKTYERSFVGDLQQMAQLATVQGMAADERQTTHLSILAEVIHSALAAGHQQAQKPFSATVFDVVCWLDETPDKIGWIIERIFNAMPQAKGENEPAKKKKTHPLKRRMV